MSQDSHRSQTSPPLLQTPVTGGLDSLRNDAWPIRSTVKFIIPILESIPGYFYFSKTDNDTHALANWLITFINFGSLREVRCYSTLDAPTRRRSVERFLRDAKVLFLRRSGRYWIFLLLLSSSYMDDWMKSIYLSLAFYHPLIKIYFHRRFDEIFLLLFVILSSKNASMDDSTKSIDVTKSGKKRAFYSKNRSYDIVIQNLSLSFSFSNFHKKLTF